MNPIHQLLTGKDGVTHDIGRWFAALGGLSGIGLQAWDVLANHAHFEMQAYGVGMAALAAGVGAMLKLKEGTEP